MSPFSSNRIVGEFANAIGSLVSIGRGDPFDGSQENTELFITVILELEKAVPPYTLITYPENSGQTNTVSLFAVGLALLIAILKF